MQRRCAYQDICNRILDPSRVEGLTDLKENLACDISDQKVCSLYEFKDGTLRMLCYTSAEPFSHFVDHFVIMMKKSSSLFLKFVDKKIETLQHKTDLTIPDIYTEIWMPVFEECQALVESLISQRITLSQVDKDLRIYSETNLEMVVQTLVDGVKECLKLSLDQEQLNNSLTKIRTYWKLSGYQTGAQVLLELKEILGLEGDFELVEKFSKELSESMKNKTLEDIDDNVTDTGNFLEGITNNSLRQKCLEAFKNSQDIVTWLKNFSERKSIKDIQGFVTVALDTAAGGEGALAHDKLSHLHTVGYGFASLIYEVNKTDGYKQLVVKCKSLWESLAKNENLPELLESCNSDLEWYKSVKETHGSVETTTYGQMTNILKYGVYAVSLREDAQTTVHTVHSLITVTLTQRYQKLAKTKYTLDELRDLESKLVLICGNETDRRVEVEHYLNLLHNATRIAELYLDLQKAGEITYSTEYLQFRCALYDEEELEAKIIHPLFDKDKAKEIMSDLQEYIRRLNKRLVDWNRSVDAARGKYYELNYFTTLQLLELQKDLGHLSQSTAAAPTVEPRVLMLLRSISPEISSTVLSDSLQAVHYGHESTLLQMPAKTMPEVENVSKEGKVPIRKKTLPSVRQKPNPTILTFEDLNEKQQVIFTNCAECDGYPKSLVLRALQACAQNASEQEIARWCSKNEGEKSIGDDTSCSESNVESIEDENDNVFLSDTEQDNVDEAFAETAPATQGLVTTQTGISSTETNHSLKIVYRPFIDETNPNVQQLVNAGCEPQDAVKAFDQFRDLQKAMNHLIALEKKEFEGGAQANEESVEKNTDIEIEEVIVYERRDPDVSKNHLKLDQLGLVLQAISKKVSGAVKEERTFSSYLFEAGQPNLLVTTQDNILRSVLALYSSDTELPLPTQEEVFLCTEKTNTEEVSLFWRRAIGDPNFKRIFCLAHAEKLSYQVCDSALKSLNELSQGKNDYRLVVICTEEGRHITSRLHLYKRPAVPPLSDIHCRAYLKDHFTQSTDTKSTSSVAGTCASTVDPDKLCVRVVSSTRSGMGKSLFIKRRAEELIKTTLNQDIHVTIPIHGPIVDSDILLDFFKEHTTRNACTLYHLDIAPRVLQKVDYLLFSLLILNGLSDSRGNVWKCQPSQLYMVEVTIPETEVGDDGFQTLKLLSLLPTSQCVSPGRVVEQDKLGDGTLGMDEKEFSSPTVQRVYQYLRRHSDKSFDLDNYVYEDSVVEGKIQDFLRVILSQCGVRDPSWTELRYFMKFLDIQLHTCENSIYCDKNILGNSMSGLKRFVIKFMIRMSRDFSTPSLVGVLNFEEEKRLGEGGQLGQYQIMKRRKWEQSSHPYIFFNDDKETITFVGFRVNELGNLIDPNDNSIIEQAIMKSELYEGLKRNKVDFNANCQDWSKEEMIKKLALVMGFKYSHDPDDSYVLTTDNLIKMLAIQMRFRCDIPVVIMGETGCGKTRLVRYMCDLARQERDIKNMLILKIHGGITDQDVIQFVEDAENKARTNKKTDSKLDTVVFFDEANTTESIGLIKEIMCDRRMNGRAISSDLKFIAACNPYRMHTEEMIHKLETAGLGFYVRETQQKLGKIPLRQLVYRVLDIPPSMRPLVYDFGQLNTDTEYDYTSQIVRDHISRHQELSAVCKENINFIKTISVVLAASQKFMRDQKNECSFVSLRDVERAMILFKYFYDKMSTVFAPLINEKTKKDLREDVPLPCSDITRALLLSLSVCYHARLQQREPYEEQISANFQTPLDLPGGAQQFWDEIEWCQGGLLDNMVIGDNIAKNAALRENVFMMTICIELRIPLFLVGKPGSSKSLAKSIIQDSLHGQRSRSPLLREFKPVHMFSYQCSQLSTPEGIIDVFKSAEKFQSSQDIKQYVSVVVLDEVGLAEDSPSLPLKALHPLLEDGTEGSGKDHQYQAVEREKRVAFIGISNWALDPAKMNRGVMVTRGEPGLQELQLSARGICSTKDNDPVREQLQRYFEPLSRAYMRICEKQKRQFFGLRDFYSLIKMLYWMCNNSKGHPLTQTQLEHAIKRNFGGLEDEDLDPFKEFQNAIDHLESKQESTGDQQLDSILNPDCTKLGLIKTSLTTKETTWHGENRYLLFLTENYAALDILKHFLEIGSKDSKDEGNQPYILFGSSFPKDNDYTQVCRNINEIKICMEIGKTVILLNLENLYESLYDVLNQYYLPYCGKRYVDLGLQTLRVKCRVDSKFKLILIGEKDTVYRKFSTPLINRLEKHFVLASSVLEKWQHELLRWFEEWIKDFSHTKEVQGNQFEEAHAFIGYQKDTPAAVIFQATIQLKSLVERQGEQKKETCCQLKNAGILNDDFLHDLLEKREDSSWWSKAVMGLSQFLLLQTASDDAIVRLQNARLTEADVELCWNLYYEHQHHHSLKEFLVNECKKDHETLMQVSTHSPLMTQKEVKGIAESLSMKFVLLDLHGFDTEVDFTNKIRPVFFQEEGNHEANPFLLIIQCDSGHLNYNLIACARYRVCHEASKAKAKDEISRLKNVTHILFIIRLPQQEVKSQFVGFQGDPWISAHIDDLRASSEATVLPEQAFTAKISELFIGKYDDLKKPLEEPEEVIALEFDQPVEEVIKYKPKTRETEEDREILEESEKVVLGEVGDMSMSEELEDTTDQSNEPEDSDEKRVLSGPLQGAQIESNKLCRESLELEKEVSDLEKSEETETGPAEYVEEADKQISTWSEKPTSDISQNHEHSHSSDTNSSVNNDGENSTEQGKVRAKRIGKSKPLHAHHQRLLGCVQAAVSMLSGSKQDRSLRRIQQLIFLIQKSIPDQLDGKSFYSLLVTFIHEALKQSEEVETSTGGKDWVLMEALNGRKLQNGGTFRNVLARRIDEVITPYFAQVIAHIDQNCNLDLLDPNNQATPISKFWLDMFKLSGGMIDFFSVATGKIMIKTEFPCQLPFSWLIKDTVDALNTNIQSIVQHSYHQFNSIQTKCVEDLRQSDVGNILFQVSEDDVDCFYHLYLNDFVRYCYKSVYEDKLGGKEYELIMNALDAMTKNPCLCSVKSLPHKIVALHLVYNQCYSEVYQFGQLVQHRPGILFFQNLLKDHADGNDWEFTLHLHAVQRVLESNVDADSSTRQVIGLSPSLYNQKQAEVTSNIHHWLNRVRLSQNVIDTILKSSVSTEAVIKARIVWQKIRALQIFAETVYVPLSDLEGMHFIIRRLDGLISNHSDFLKKENLDLVQAVLSNIFEAKKLKIDKADVVTWKKVSRCCKHFFVELVSSLCFGGREAPEPALVMSLIDMVLGGTCTEPSKFTTHIALNDSPVVRSFLLQLLLERNHFSEDVDEYFCKVLVNDSGQAEQELCLLCIHCFEDTCSKKILALPRGQRSPRVKTILQSSFKFLQEHLKPEATLKYLQAVGRVRFGLSFVVEQLIQDQIDDDLLQVVQSLCADPSINERATAGPAIYLIKLIIRHFGFSYLEDIGAANSWIIPKKIAKEYKEEEIDMFLIYGNDYMTMRNAVSTAMLTENTEELQACIEGGCKPSFFTLALYQKATLSRASKTSAKPTQTEGLHVLDTYIKEWTGLSPYLKQMMRLLLGNQQGGMLAQMTVSPIQPALCRTLGGIVVHTVTAIMSNSDVDLFLPFVNILTNPSALENAYLPTMPEDMCMLPEVRKTGGAFYQCPNQHPYFVGECKHTVEEEVCRECGTRIHHQKKINNGRAEMIDATRTGHDLGDSKQRPINVERERDLSATAVCIIRAIMHSLFVWAACNNQQELMSIAEVTKGKVSPKNLPEFFWMHLEKDIECLRRCTGRGVDECAIIVHQVLQRILFSSSHTSAIVTDVKCLKSKNARRDWEQLFNYYYIKPVITNLDASITKAINVMTSGDQQETNHLLYLAFEKMKLNEPGLETHLWTYRPLINLDHLKRIVQIAGSSSILDAFLEVEPSLRATQYLPDIVKLQRFLFNFYNKRLRKGEAKDLTINDFFEKVQKKFNVNTKNECRAMFHSLSQAWKLVRHKLKNYNKNRLVVEEQYLLQEFTPDTQLVYLIPTTIREGRCTTVLVDHLVLTHNDFIEKCRKHSAAAAEGKGAEFASFVWRNHKVPITHIYRCHMMEYELQLQSIIVSHCHCSLSAEEGQQIEFDLEALEKQILNQFVYGKPIIQMDIPNVAYCKDIHTVETFLEIRCKVKPQEVLDQRIQQDIVTELRTPDKLRECLDVVEIVMGLLSSEGGNPKLKLKTYIDSCRMKNKSFSAKAKEHCTLGHVISLWETICVELARQLWEKKLEPFEAIPGECMTDLTGGQKVELDKCLRMFDLGLLLGALFEYIEIHVKQTTTMDKTHHKVPLVKALGDYWAITEQSPIDLERLRKDFPSTITVEQAVAAWKHIADYKVKPR